LQGYSLQVENVSPWGKGKAVNSEEAAAVLVHAQWQRNASGNGMPVATT
jgi:hypothetical protein